MSGFNLSTSYIQPIHGLDAPSTQIHTIVTHPTNWVCKKLNYNGDNLNGIYELYMVLTCVVEERNLS